MYSRNDLIGWRLFEVVIELAERDISNTRTIEQPLYRRNFPFFYFFYLNTALLRRDALPFQHHIVEVYVPDCDNVTSSLFFKPGHKAQISMKRSKFSVKRVQSKIPPISPPKER